MALSQIQCLDDNHVNWRLNESKPEFFYSEDQRLALEALITGGRDDFEKYIKEHEIRAFLSEPELERLYKSTEVYKPGSEHHKPDSTAEGEDGTVSLQYWPDRSDISIPDLDLGWPDCVAYRGVTRVNVYMQPPMDGQTHIKEVVRKAIAQAQKLVAVVMDVFTDVDIFKDLLDAGFKRKVAVYIIIEQAGVQHFLNMCERANMHGGHLKNLRVRCCGGSEFYTRSAKKVRGSLSQRFMFIDGDRAISGSYSFTWTASRLDRNLITVLSGQAVETFDKQFRELYLTSRGVNLSKLPLAAIPEPDPVPVPAPAPVPSATIAKKLINPKYALVSVDSASRSSSDKASTKKNSSQNPLPQKAKPAKEPVEVLPVHPGLIGLPKAELISYLPTWPEPDPPSDVIGFINIRDTSRPPQAHLMRSQLFETSQAIRFKDPFTMPPEDPLPDRASPRPKTGIPDKHEEGAPKKSDLPQSEGQIEPQTESKPKQTSENQTNLPLKSASNPAKPPTQSDSKPTQPENQQQAPQPPVPKPRTLQLVLNPTRDPESPEVSFIKRKLSETSSTAKKEPAESLTTGGETSSSEDYVEPPEERAADHTETDTDASREDKPLSAGGEEEMGQLEEEEDKDDKRDNDMDSVKVTYTHSLKDKDESSTASDEYYECSDSEHVESNDPLVNGRTTGSGRYGDHSPSADALNVMARFSQSMLDLRAEDHSESQLQIPAQLLNAQLGNKGKIYHMTSRSPARVAYGRNRGKVVITKPGIFPRMPKSDHKYWQGKLLNVECPPNREISPNRQSYQNIYRTGRSPRRHGTPNMSGRLYSHKSPAQHLAKQMRASPSPRRTDTRPHQGGVSSKVMNL
ncbi:protein FAM83G [Chanos chanos]|uniref:Protein FAM83G n=1 Tax=Chanos chanos TaxID=29144 RepID=A0A6J2VWE1_CHACN|nr:protein FAM83G [Chanos chanos]